MQLKIRLFSLPACLLATAATLSAGTFPVVHSPSAETRITWAASELSTMLQEICPEDRFPITTEVPRDGDYILLTDDAASLLVREEIKSAHRDEPGEFVVSRIDSENRQIGIIAGHDARAVLDGVYSLLEQNLGYGFYLYRNASEAADTEPFAFRNWDLQDKPLVQERVLFNWYNFISGVSTWNLRDYKHWIRQAARMRHTDVMLHAYGWAPFTEFTHNGVTKPVEYLQTTPPSPRLPYGRATAAAPASGD